MPDDITEPVFRGRFELHLCSRDEHVKRVREVRPDHAYADVRPICIARAIELRPGHVAIWFDDGDGFVRRISEGDAAAIAVVAHECLHAVGFVLENVGIRNVGEPMCYYLDWLMREVLRRIDP